jgi:CheY-like chemotaxis protein
MPIVVYTGKDLSRDEERELKRLAQTIILKDVRSPERLLDETSLFLHRNAANLPDHKREVLERLHRSDALLAGKKVLLVDDDVRNIFAMTSVLERHRMEVFPAESGKDALAMLDQNPDVDVVLMDIMLPEMDGYETTRAIRKEARFKDLPVIALTAKAMKGDREKCIEAGASDYIAKPVDTEQLLSLLRVWLYR